MAIVKINKFNLYSFENKREILLKALQKFKYVHFNNLERIDDNEEIELEKVEVPEEMLVLDEKILQTDWAINLLKTYKPKKSSIQSMKEGNETLTLLELTNRAEAFDFDMNYNALYELSEKRASFEQKIQSLNSQIDELTPWREVPYELKELESTRSVEIRLGTIPTKYLADLNNDLDKLENSMVEVVSERSKISYLILIADINELEEVEDAIRRNGFSQVRLRTEDKVENAIFALEEEKKFTEAEIKKTSEQIYSYFNLLEDFTIYYEYLRNKKLRLVSSENFLKTDQIDLIEGYIPSKKKDEFIKLLNDLLENDYYLEIYEAELDDPKVPILLENNRFARNFEMLTEMFSLPRYNEIDPTPFFAPFYFIFAGMMVGDFGYGLLLFLGSLFVLKKFNLDDAKRKFITFFNYLGISSMIWGLIFGSCFGDLIPMKALIDPSKDYTQMILMSLILGAIHIFFALGLKAYMNIRDHKPLDALYDVGFWYVALITATIVVAPKIESSVVINPVIFKVSKILMILSFIAIILTGGRENKGIGSRLAWGVYSLYGITGYLGDFVSYLRLMALALAGSFIAVAVNIIVRMLFAGGVIGIIAGSIVFVIFQLFNMFLSFLSAYVHSARLTYVEMFNKFYEGGGIPFKTMVEKSKYFNIKEE